MEGDLRLLNEQRLPIFSLAAAMAQPDAYKGRFILVRAQVGDVRVAEEKPTVWLVEQGLGSVATEQQVGTASRRDTSSTTSGNLSGETTLVGGNVNGSLSKDKTTRDSKTVLRYDNISSDTGREALGRLPKAIRSWRRAGTSSSWRSSTGCGPPRARSTRRMRGRASPC